MLFDLSENRFPLFGSHRLPSTSYIFLELTTYFSSHLMRGILHFLFIIAPRGLDFAPQLLLRALAAIEQSEIGVRAISKQ